MLQIIVLLHKAELLTNLFNLWLPSQFFLGKPWDYPSRTIDHTGLLLRRQCLPPVVPFTSTPKEAASDFINPLEEPFARLENCQEVCGDGGKHRVYKSQIASLIEELSFPSSQLGRQLVENRLNVDLAGLPRTRGLVENGLNLDLFRLPCLLISCLWYGSVAKKSKRKLDNAPGSNK